MSAAPLIYSWSSQNTAGDTKRKTTSALVFIGSSAGNVLGPLLFRPDEAPGYGRGIRSNMILFVAVMLLVGVTSLHLRRLNCRHSLRRVALGKSARVTDLSLETAEEAERLSRLARAMPQIDPGQPNGSVDVALGDARDDGAVGHTADKADKSFADATDLENEDFLFVY